MYACDEKSTEHLDINITSGISAKTTFAVCPDALPNSFGAYGTTQATYVSGKGFPFDDMVASGGSSYPYYYCCSSRVKYINQTLSWFAVRADTSDRKTTIVDSSKEQCNKAGALYRWVALG